MGSPYNIEELLIRAYIEVQKKFSTIEIPPFGLIQQFMKIQHHWESPVWAYIAVHEDLAPFKAPRAWCWLFMKLHIRPNQGFRMVLKSHRMLYVPKCSFFSGADYSRKAIYAQWRKLFIDNFYITTIWASKDSFWHSANEKNSLCKIYFLRAASSEAGHSFLLLEHPRQDGSAAVKPEAAKRCEAGLTAKGHPVASGKQKKKTLIFQEHTPSQFRTEQQSIHDRIPPCESGNKGFQIWFSSFME